MISGGQLFVLAIIAMPTIGWLANNWIRARHGYPLEDEQGQTAHPAGSAAHHQLKQENAELREQLEHFSDRVKVLERIVTDKGYDVATQIEALRDDRKVDALLTAIDKDRA